MYIAFGLQKTKGSLCENNLNRYQEQRQEKQTYTYFFKLLLLHATCGSTHPTNQLIHTGCLRPLYTQSCIINTSSPENISDTLAGNLHPKLRGHFGTFLYSMATTERSLPELKTLPS